MKYIFLDFDGVLHGKKENVDLFYHSPLLCQTIRPYIHDVRIVISSSWRETFDYDIIIDHLDDDIKAIVHGVTPILVNGFEDEGRFLEIMKYCEENQIAQHNWIALDDMQRLFPLHCNNLILVDQQIGLTSDNLHSLVNFLNPKHTLNIKYK